jgi:hypothetical protein
MAKERKIKLPRIAASFPPAAPTPFDTPSGPPSRDVEATHPQTPPGSAGDAPEIIEEPTLGDLQKHAIQPPRRSTVIAAEFSDDPLPLPTQLPLPPTFEGVGDVAARVVDALPRLPRNPSPSYSRPLPPMPSYVPDSTQYRVRITPLEVYRYPGFISADAPAFVDRNWIAFSGADEEKGYPAGPSIHVPGVGIARKDWFVVRETVEVADSIVRERVNVYEPDQFFNWFIPIIPVPSDEDDGPDDAA